MSGGGGGRRYVGCLPPFHPARPPAKTPDTSTLQYVIQWTSQSLSPNLFYSRAYGREGGREARQESRNAAGDYLKVNTREGRKEGRRERRKIWITNSLSGPGSRQHRRILNSRLSSNNPTPGVPHQLLSPHPSLLTLPAYTEGLHKWPAQDGLIPGVPSPATRLREVHLDGHS